LEFDGAFLRNVMLFAEFEPEELRKVASAMRSSLYQLDQVILEEGKPNRALHVLKSGRICVTRNVHDSEVALCDLEAGQTFGELSIIEDGVASATLRSVMPSEVLSISMEDLAAFLNATPSAAAKFWRAVAMDLRRRLLQTNDVVRSYFEVNRALIENPKFREAYAMCNKV
jgi:CRP/FNR family cyclic AMP-dependent transcriptional regulator